VAAHTDEQPLGEQAVKSRPNYGKQLQPFQMDILSIEDS